jgi:hypothetical protein
VSVVERARAYVQCRGCGVLVWSMTTVLRPSPTLLVEHWCLKCHEARKLAELGQ